MARLALIVLCALAFLTTPAASTTVNVDWAGGGDYQAIQDGINAAGEGDTVLVTPGTYQGMGNHTLDFNGVNMVLRSSGGRSVTTLDLLNTNPGFYLWGTGEDSTCVIDGFTFLNGLGPGTGGGISARDGSSLKIQNCTFTGGNATWGGGIFLSDQTTPTVVSNCVFCNNSSTDNIGGAVCTSLNVAPIIIRDCVFYDNEADSYGGAVALSSPGPTTIARSTFVGNVSNPPLDCSIAVFTPTTGTISVTNCIIAHGSGVPTYGPAETSHCVVFQNAGGDSLSGPHHDNLFTDPLFCDVDTRDLTLCNDSPCLPGGNAWGELVGRYADGCAGCDSPVEISSWGSIKGMFR